MLMNDVDSYTAHAAQRPSTCYWQSTQCTTINCDIWSLCVVCQGCHRSKPEPNGETMQPVAWL